jgi:sulfur carrier protein
VIITLRQPKRTITVEGPATVAQLLEHFELLPESTLVIREGVLLVRSDRLQPDDNIELRPVISGG